MRLVDQSTRATIRTLTILAAAMSLLLTLITPFVGTAWAGHGDPYHALNGTLDDPGFFKIEDSCRDGAEVEEDDEEPGPDDIIDTTGGKKWATIHDEPAPVIRYGNVPGKNDICDFWLDSAVDVDSETGDIWVYAAFSLATSNGTFKMLMELLHEVPECDLTDIATCNPFSERNEGSTLIAFEGKGSSPAVISQSTWDHETETWGPFVPIAAADADGSMHPDGLFGEMAVNLTAADILPGAYDEEAECEVISAIIPMSLPGESLTSAPKDVVLGTTPPIETCGSLKVIKDAGGDDFDFVFPITAWDGDDELDSDDLIDGGSFTVDELKAGEDYAVSENVPNGWALTDIDCTLGEGSTGTGSFNAETGKITGVKVEAGKTTTCTVTNELITEELEATKTADAEYDRTVTWTLEKTVDPASHTGAAGQDAGDSTWTVTATKDEVEDNFSVTGTITIDNPNVIPVDVTVSDQLDDDTTATVDCDPVAAGNQNTATIPAGGTLVCSYSASPSDASATLNTATITSNTSVVDGTTATAAVSFTENLFGDEEVTLEDERFEYSEVISSTTTETFPETFACPSDPSVYDNGVNQRTEENTATLTGDDTDLDDSAQVTITCGLAAGIPEKDAVGLWDRTVDWDLEKSVDVDGHDGTGGADAGTSTWTVEATKTETLSNYLVTGTITVENPSATTRTFTVTDVLNDDTVASVDCDGEGSNEITLAGGAEGTCTYIATPEDDSATQNTVTISAPGNPDQTFTTDIDWSENLIGDDEVTLEDPRFEYSETIDETTTVEFEETFACSSDLSDYTDGVHEFTETNTATLTGDNTDLESSADVEVNCTLPSLTIEKDVQNNNGGELGEDAFAPTLADGDDSIDLDGWGEVMYLLPGTYTVGEDLDAMPSGYVMTGISCTDETELEGPGTVEVTIDGDDAVVCTITNEDQPATLTLVKTVVNDDGGTLEADDFPVFVNDDEVAWETEISIPAGEHTVSEEQQAGYLAGPWGGDCAADGTFTAEVGGSYTCTITNDDLPAGLTIVKEILIGDLEPEDFPLLITDGDGATQTVSSGQVTTLPAGTYTIGEEQQEGYELVSIICDNGVEADEGEETVTVTVGLDETVVCTITNAEVQVLPEVELLPEAEELPATGLYAIRLAMLSALFAALGALFLLGTSSAPATGRRRRD